MFKITLIGLICISILSADTITVNQQVYENSIINLCDTSLQCADEEFKYIQIKGYGTFAVSVSGECTNKPTMGVFKAKTCGLSTKISDTLLYDSLPEQWSATQIPSQLHHVPYKLHAISSVGSFDDTIHFPIVGIASNPLTNTHILPLYEWGTWSMYGDPPYSHWMNIFGIKEEIFYLCKPGENSVKFQVEKRDDNPSENVYRMKVATDSLGNGIFKIDNSSLSEFQTKNIKKPNIFYRNNTLHFPNAIKDNALIIFNSIGQIIKSYSKIGTSLNVKELSNGVYYYRLINQQKINQGRFLKKN